MRSLIFILCCFACLPSGGQGVSWSVPISVAPSSFGNYFPRIKLDRSGDPMITWGTPTEKLQFSRWDGISFSTPVTLNNASTPAFSADWAGPEIGNLGDTVYVVFKQTPESDTSKHINLFRSFDGGQSFAGPVRVDYIGDSLSRFAAVTADDLGHPIVTLLKFKSGLNDHSFVVARSNDYGATFLPAVPASGFTGGEACDCCPPSVVNEGNRTVVLYRNNLNHIRTIWAGLSYDNGNNFPAGLEIDNTAWMVMGCPSSGPDGIVIGDTLYSVFRSSAMATRVYFSKSTVSGAQLVSCGQITADFPGLNSQDYPRIAHSGTAAAVALKEVSGGIGRVVVAYTADIQSGQPFSFDTVANGVTNVDIAMKDGDIHVVWENDVNGTVMYSKGTYNATSVRSVSGPLQISLYPNPVSTAFAVPAGTAGCLLTDISGRTFSLDPVSAGGGLQVSVRQLPRGIYTVHLTDNNGKIYQSKLTIQ